MGAVGIDDAREFPRDMGKRLVHRGRHEFAPFVAHQALAQAIGGIVRFGQFAALHAGIAAKGRVIRIAAHGDDAPVGNIHLHRAIGMAEAAEGLVGVRAHDPLPRPRD